MITELSVDDDFDSLEVFEENVMINRDDLYFNMDKFESGKSNIILITGFSGSGKTTLAKELASKYHCDDYVELDSLEWCFNDGITEEELKKGVPACYDFLQSHPEYKNMEKRPAGNEYLEIYRKFIPFVINWCKKRKPKKYVIEGLQLYESLKKGESYHYTSEPTVIKGTSAIKSIYRAMKRNGASLKEIPGYLQWYVRTNSQVEALYKAMKAEYEPASVKEFSESVGDSCMDSELFEEDSPFIKALNVNAKSINKKYIDGSGENIRKQHANLPHDVTTLKERLASHYKDEFIEILGNPGIQRGDIDAVMTDMWFVTTPREDPYDDKPKKNPTYNYFSPVLKRVNSNEETVKAFNKAKSIMHKNLLECHNIDKFIKVVTHKDKDKEDIGYGAEFPWRPLLDGEYAESFEESVNASQVEKAGLAPISEELYKKLESGLDYIEHRVLKEHKTEITDIVKSNPNIKEIAHPSTGEYTLSKPGEAIRGYYTSWRSFVYTSDHSEKTEKDLRRIMDMVQSVIQESKKDGKPIEKRIHPFTGNLDGNYGVSVVVSIPLKKNKGLIKNRKFTESVETEVENMDSIKEEGGQSVGAMLPVTEPDQVLSKTPLSQDAIDAEFSALQFKPKEEPEVPVDVESCGEENCDESCDTELEESVSEEIDNEFELFTEGVHHNIKVTFKQYKKIYKDNIKKAENEYKSKDYKAAEKSATKAKVAMQKCLVEIQNTNVNTLQSCIGYICQGYIDVFRATAAGLVTFGIGSVVSEINSIIKELVGFMDTIDTDGVDISVIDRRRNRFIGETKTLITSANKMIQKARSAANGTTLPDENTEELDKKKGKKKAVTESADDILDSMFESLTGDVKEDYFEESFNELDAEDDEPVSILESAEFHSMHKNIEQLCRECGIGSLEPVFEEGEDIYVCEDGDEEFNESGRDIDDDIKPIIEKLNAKGYKTTASCSGHPSSREKNDVYKDGIKYNHLYSTARIVFEKAYDFPNIPDGWKKKVMEDGKVGIYVKGPRFKVINGLPPKQYENWKRRYMYALTNWVDSLPNEGETKDDDNSELSVEESVFRDVYIDATIGIDD